MLTSTHRTRSSISCTIPAESIEIYPNRGAFERPFYLRLRPTPFLPLARRNLSLRDDLEWEIRRMFKVAKGRQSAASKPDIWAEGKQFAPLDPMLLARVTAIIARRSAAHIWTKGSDLGADLSLAIEEGLWARAVSKLGRATAVLPSRAATARLMARLSRMQRRASSQVDHHRISVEPLEFGDLHSYMDERRAQAIVVQRERARKEKLAQSARERAATLALRASAAVDTRPNRGSAPLAETSADQTTTIAYTELLAIRAALAEVPDFPPAPVAMPSAPLPDILAPSLFAKSASAAFIADAQKRPPTEPMAKRSPGILYRLAAAVGGAIGRAGGWVLSRIGSALSPPIHNALAWSLGWGLFLATLLYGFASALSAHYRGQDLRDFD